MGQLVAMRQLVAIPARLMTTRGPAGMSRSGSLLPSSSSSAWLTQTTCSEGAVSFKSTCVTSMRPSRSLALHTSGTTRKT